MMSLANGYYLVGNSAFDKYSTVSVNGIYKEVIMLYQNEISDDEFGFFPDFEVPFSKKRDKTLIGDVLLDGYIPQVMIDILLMNEISILSDFKEIVLNLFDLHIALFLVVQVIQNIPKRVILLIQIFLHGICHFFQLLGYFYVVGLGRYY